MELKNRVELLAKSDPFNRQFNIKFINVNRGNLKGEIQLTELMKRQGNVIHGGFLAGLVDIAGSLCIFTFEEVMNGFTISMNVNYLNTLTGSMASFESTAERAGKRHIFMDIGIWDENNVKVVSANGIWSVVK